MYSLWIYVLIALSCRPIEEPHKVWKSWLRNREVFFSCLIQRNIWELISKYECAFCWQIFYLKQGKMCLKSGNIWGFNLMLLSAEMNNNILISEKNCWLLSTQVLSDYWPGYKNYANVKLFDLPKNHPAYQRIGLQF